MEGNSRKQIKVISSSQGSSVFDLHLAISVQQIFIALFLKFFKTFVPPEKDILLNFVFFMNTFLKSISLVVNTLYTPG